MQNNFARFLAPKIIVVFLPSPRVHSVVANGVNSAPSILITRGNVSSEEGLDCNGKDCCLTPDADRICVPIMAFALLFPQWITFFARGVYRMSVDTAIRTNSLNSKAQKHQLRLISVTVSIIDISLEEHRHSCPLRHFYFARVTCHRFIIKGWYVIRRLYLSFHISVSPKIITLLNLIMRYNNHYYFYLFKETISWYCINNKKLYHIEWKNPPLRNNAIETGHLVYGNQISFSNYDFPLRCGSFGCFDLSYTHVFRRVPVVPQFLPQSPIVSLCVRHRDF